MAYEDSGLTVGLKPGVLKMDLLRDDRGPLRSQDIFLNLAGRSLGSSVTKGTLCDTTAASRASKQSKKAKGKSKNGETLARILPRSEPPCIVCFGPASMQRTLVALWFADIARYSTYAAEDESGALRLVEILQALSREIVPRHKGRVVKFVGDAVLAEFPSTELAVRAAAALSHEFREQSATGGEAHDLRVGVHLADVAVAPDGDLYGDGVNAAARIQETAQPGQVVISEDVWRQLRGRREFQFQDLGERSLKGTGSIDLYAVNVQVDQARSLGSNLTKDVHLAEGKKSTIRSVAVLPLADLSAERDQEYFGDGVAEEILNALAKIGGLHVPARTSCFAFRGATVDAREIGRRLGVEALLEGSIRKAGDRLRITVQLIDARNGFQLWSERFDREL